MTSNWIRFLIALVTGVTLGLVYGWVVSPVQYIDVTPNILRKDYRTDYVLMTAEAYQSEQNAETAARRLAILGSESPAQIVASALEYATSNRFTEDEVLLLQGLLTTMQTYQPQGDNIP
jgi:PHD/YefM family antitoxin component YafN of YafNO toxin-antitoxin module